MHPNEVQQQTPKDRAMLYLYFLRWWKLQNKNNNNNKLQKNPNVTKFRRFSTSCNPGFDKSIVQIKLNHSEQCCMTSHLNVSEAAPIC